MRVKGHGLTGLTGPGSAERRTRVAGPTTPVTAACRGLAVLWLAVAAAPAVAQQVPVRLGGVASSFVGVPFDMPLEVDLTGRADKLGSFAVRITWNPSVLAFVSGRDGNFGALSANTDSAGGVIRLTGVNPGGVGGKVVIGVARFVPLAASSDTIHLDVTELYAAGSFADLLPSAVWANQPYCPAVGRFGDMDGNQTVNSADALQALSLAAGLSISGTPALGDVDGDGVTGARDALLMLSAGIGLDVGGFRVFLIAPGACAAPRRPLLAMTPGNLTMDVGQQARYTAFASDSAGAGVVVTDIVWRTSDSLVARVTPTGDVTAVAPGVATITVRRTTGTSASATVTVLQRHTHWVDALASPEDFNQLGAPQLPFRTIPQALSYADPGDTVRVRSGRYDDTLVIDRPVVLMGDTAGGKPRPLLSAFRYGSAGVTVHTAGRVELQALRVDTLTVGVAVERVDTLLVRWMEFRAAAESYQASLFVDTAGVVLVQRSDFFGPGSQYYYANNGIVVDSARVVSIDSSYVAEYGYDAIVLYNVDSVSVRGSRIRDNYGYGVYYCAQCYGTGVASNAVFSGNRFVQNNYGHVYVDNARTVRFDHNRAVGGGYDGYTIYGDTAATLVTLLGDSLATRDYGSWLYLYNFDSLAVDSAVVLVRNGYPSINGGSAVSVRDSKFLEVTGYALHLYPYPQDSTNLLLRRVEFRGPDSTSCDRCGDMVYGSYLNVDADSVTMTNFYYGFSLYSSRILLRHATLQHYWYGAYLSCGYANVADASLTSGYYGLELYACGAADSMVVANTTLAHHSSYGIYSSGAGATVVSNSQLSDNYNAIYQSCGELRVTNVTATGGYYGVDGYGCSATDTVLVDQSSFAQFYYGAYLSNGTSQVTNSVFTDDSYGIYQSYGRHLAFNNQIVRPRYYGIYFYNYREGTPTRLSGNTITCDTYGAANAAAVYGNKYYYASAATDTVELLSNTVSGCYSGLNVYGPYARVRIAGNTVSLPAASGNGIVSDADTLLQIVSNSVTGPARYGAIRVEDGPRRAEVDSNTVSNGLDAGIYVRSVDTLFIRDNAVSDVAPGTCCLSSPTGGIVLESSSSTDVQADVRRNRMTRTTSGIVMERGLLDTVTVRVDSNAIRGSDSMGVWVRYYSRALIRYNAIDSSGIDAVRLSDTYFAAAPAVLDSNNFTRSQHFAVRNLSGYTVDATDNWWGDLDNSGPACAAGCGNGDSVSTLVTFNPWLPGAFATLLPAPRLVAAAPFAAPLVSSAVSATASFRVWEQPSVTPPQRERTRPRVTTTPATSAGPAATAANPAVRRLEAVSRVQGDRVRQRQAERAQLLERQEARRALREQQRAERQQAEAAREAQRQPPAAPPRRQQ